MAIGSDRALTGAFGCLNNPPIIVDTTASTTPARLTAVLSNDLNHKLVRRCRFTNLDGVNTISLLFTLVTASTNFAASGLTVASGIRVPPGASIEVSWAASLDVGVVSSAGTPAFNAAISDT